MRTTLTRSSSRLRRTLGVIAIAAAFGTVLSITAFADTTILNVSYDPTRELYKEYDQVFAAYWQEKTGEAVTIEQSHGGSSAQARAFQMGAPDISLNDVMIDMQKAGIAFQATLQVRNRLVQAYQEIASMPV